MVSHYFDAIFFSWVMHKLYTNFDLNLTMLGHFGASLECVLFVVFCITNLFFFVI